MDQRPTIKYTYIILCEFLNEAMLRCWLSINH